MQLAHTSVKWYDGSYTDCLHIFNLILAQEIYIH